MNPALRAVKPRELRTVYEDAEAAGCTIEITRSTHIRVTTPAGRIFTGPVTSSDRRGYHRTRSDLRRMGVAI
jgi:hypothetical protein